VQYWPLMRIGSSRGAGEIMRGIKPRKKAGLLESGLSRTGLGTESRAVVRVTKVETVNRH